MSTLILIILIPLILPWIFRLVWPHNISWAEMGVAIVVGVALSASVYGLGLYSETADTEILNGQVVSKKRVHDTYEEPYECSCTTDKNGSRSCSTCYETHYTVKWVCETNINDIEIGKKDSTSRLVYTTPDPARYTIINPGDPVAQEHSFPNYVKAAPDSLFHQNKTDKFKSLIPPYPKRVYDFYHVDRVFAMGVQVPDLVGWNNELSLLLRKLGPQKQANVIIIFVNTNDESYIHSLEGEWIGGKKNDIIVIVGTTNYPKIDWIHVSSWTDSTIFKVKLRDDLLALGNINRPQVLNAIDTNTMNLFKRKSMKDFDYLKDQIEPPTWVLILALVLGILSSVGVSTYFYYNDPFGPKYKSYRGRSRLF